MGTKVHNNYEDLITFTRASEGYALRPVSYGDELVTNGTFDSDSGWTKGTGWSISGGVATSSGTTGVSIRQDGVFTLNKVYEITGDATVTAGELRVWDSTGGQPTLATATGSFRLIFVPTVNTTLYLLGQSNFTGTVDNVSVKEVTFDESDGTLTLFEHPNNVPRVEYDGSRNRLGLLVEAQRTNLFTDSLMATSAWADSRGNLLANRAISPERLQNATEFREDTSTGRHYFNESITGLTSGTDYTVSLYVKRGATAGAYRAVIITPNNLTFLQDMVVFDFDTESITQTGTDINSTKVDNVGNGWFRISVSFTSASTSGGVAVTLSRFSVPNTSSPSHTGNGVESIYVYGAQFEQGNFGSSFIKTSGSTASRSQEIVNIDLSSFGYNHKKGSLLVDALSEYNSDGSDFRSLFHIGSTVSVVDRINVYISEGGPAMAAEVRANNVLSAGLSLETLTENPVSKKVAFAFAEDDFAASDDGDTAVTDTSGTLVPLNRRNRLSLGSSTSQGNSGRFHIKSFKYYPRRLTNAQLKDLSS